MIKQPSLVWAFGTLVLIVSIFLIFYNKPTRISVKGEFLGIKISTTVDSEVARYYVEEYVHGKNEKQELHERIDELYVQYRKSLPSRVELATISSDFSVDFAALFFADRLLADECNRSINQNFVQYLGIDGAAGLNASPYLLLFVPGWDYAENGHLTGADFAQPRKLATKLGIENYLVQLPPTGSVEESAAVLAAEIAKHVHSDKRIVLAGASSAGPAIQLTLGELLGKEELSSVKAWLNLGGILQGSPLVDYLQLRPQRWLFNLVVWFKGWHKNSILSMGIVPSRKRFQRLKISADIFIVNYLGIPLSGQLSRYSKDKYPLLASNGPNDGLTLISDVIAPNSLTIVALGSDHFFAEDPKINDKTEALMKLIIRFLEKDVSSRSAGRCSIDSRSAG
jgi:hypothetical protein